MYESGSELVHGSSRVHSGSADGKACKVCPSLLEAHVHLHAFWQEFSQVKWAFTWATQAKAMQTFLDCTQACLRRDVMYWMIDLVTFVCHDCTDS